MLSAKRDARVAERFFRKAMNATHNQEPRVINVNRMRDDTLQEAVIALAKLCEVIDLGDRAESDLFGSGYESVSEHLIEPIKSLSTISTRKCDRAL